jgi:homoserine dehydrogenase
MADKGPLALRYPELEALAKERGVGLYFSAACGGGLPILSIGRRDLAGARIETFEGVLTHTTNIILSGMSEGQNWDEAWSRALSVGQAETDPRLDISGLDSAAKLCIVANAVLGRPARIHDVSVTGIQGIDQERVRDARRNGRELKLVCRARREGQGYILSVAPEELDAAHPLARIGQGSVAAIFDTDVSGRFFTELSAPDPGPAARLVMADMIDSVKAS